MEDTDENNVFGLEQIYYRSLVEIAKTKRINIDELLDRLEEKLDLLEPQIEELEKVFEKGRIEFYDNKPPKKPESKVLYVKDQDTIETPILTIFNELNTIRGFKAYTSLPLIGSLSTLKSSNPYEILNYATISVYYANRYGKRLNLFRSFRVELVDIKSFLIPTLPFIDKYYIISVEYRTIYNHYATSKDYFIRIIPNSFEFIRPVIKLRKREDQNVSRLKTVIEVYNRPRYKGLEALTYLPDFLKTYYPNSFDTSRFSYRFRVYRLWRQGTRFYSHEENGESGKNGDYLSHSEEDVDFSYESITNKALIYDTTLPYQEYATNSQNLQYIINDELEANTIYGVQVTLYHVLDPNTDPNRIDASYVTFTTAHEENGDYYDRYFGELMEKYYDLEGDIYSLESPESQDSSDSTKSSN